jgi:hypothetical protein
MAIDDYKKSGVSFKGVTQDNYDMAKKLNDLGKEQADIYKQQGAVLGTITGAFSNLNKAAEDYKDAMEGNLDLSEEQVEKLKESLENSEKMGGAITELAPGLVSMAQGAQAFGAAMSTALGPIGLIIAAFVIVYKIISGVAKQIAETRKDLGVSAAEAIKIEAAFFGLSKAAALSGLESDDLKESFLAARENLGATRDEAIGLSLSLAQTAMRSGQNSDQLTKTLSLMESISGASRDALLSQIEMTGQMIEQAGLAPGDIFKDIADNAEHFASFAKDGGGNIIKAAMAAKQLGLSMSDVAGTTESLLDFESSIEKQMEASMMIGRQINLDRARQLALSGDQEGMMKEIKRLVGSEAEFNKMNVLARRSLAESVGMSVEGLSRMVRGNQAGATGAAAGNAFGDAQQQQVFHLNKIVENTSPTGFLGRHIKKTSDGVSAT